MTTEIAVTRMTATSTRTVSRLDIDGNPFCFILEDAIRETKIPSETCIPAGRYQVIRRYHGRFYENYKSRFGHAHVFEIVGIPNYSDVLIHIGNDIADTRGCLLTGCDVTFSQIGNPKITLARSTEAYKALYTAITRQFDEGKDVFITVVR
jgi:hypothetical protein